MADLPEPFRAAVEGLRVALTAHGRTGLARLALGEARRWRLRDWSRAAAAGYVFLAVAISGIVAVLLKYGLGRARPAHFEEVGPYSFQFITWEPSWASFPSGHATTAMALGVALGLLYPRLMVLFVCAGFWIAFSRIVTGAHYPSDLIAGCLLGAAISLAWIRLAGSGAVAPSPARLGWFALAFVAAAWLMSFTHVGWWMIRVATFLSGNDRPFPLGGADRLC